MNVTITGRPRYAASDTGLPAWSVSAKPGARRAPAAQDTSGPPAPIGPFDTAAGVDDGRSAKIAAPATTPTRSTEPQSTQRSRTSGLGAGLPGSTADGWFAATRERRRG